MGTSFSYLNAAAVLITGTDFAKDGSISLASADSTAVKTKSNLLGSISCTLLSLISWMYSGICSLLCHLIIPDCESYRASAYLFPADLSDEAICDRSNHGCLFKAMINSCPTAPVAP